MSARRLRAFAPHKGRLREISEEQAAKLARAPRKEWRPPPTLVGTIAGVTIVYVPTIHGQKRCQVATSQARKVVDAAIAVGLVHAVAWFGMVTGPPRCDDCGRVEGGAANVDGCFAWKDDDIDQARCDEVAASRVAA